MHLLQVSFHLKNNLYSIKHPKYVKPYKYYYFLEFSGRLTTDTYAFLNKIPSNEFCISTQIEKTYTFSPGGSQTAKVT